MMEWLQKISKTILLVIAASLALTTLGLAIYVNISESTKMSESTNADYDFLIHRYVSKMGTFKNWAVTMDSPACSEIAGNVLRRNGTAVDAAIAGLFCSGVMHPNSMGIGGGFIMTIYIKSMKKVFSLMARETAPRLAYQAMFVNRSEAGKNGPLSIAVPGEVLGYEEAKHRFGNPEISWSSLIEPSIRICKEGVIVSPYFADLSKIDSAKMKYENDPILSRTFLNPSTKELYRQGETYQRPILANTLRKIAMNGAQELYDGETGKKLIQDIQAMGGILQDQDLRDYRVKWDLPIVARLKNNLLVHTSPPPSSGVVLASVLATLSHLDWDERDYNNPVSFHLFIEALKFGFAKRTRLGDWNMLELRKTIKQLVAQMTSYSHGQIQSKQLKWDDTNLDPTYYGVSKGEKIIEDQGTSHSNFMAPNGDCVSVTSTINSYFGSGKMSKQTGIILNNEMDDFSTSDLPNLYGIPPSKSNAIRPGARPVSSMVPTIITDLAGNPKLIVGASGGPKILSATAMVCILHLYFGRNIQDAIQHPRLHHQLLPMEIVHDKSVPREVLKYLRQIGHQLQPLPEQERFAVVQGISLMGEDITASFDSRKSGSLAGD